MSAQYRDTLLVFDLLILIMSKIDFFMSEVTSVLKIQDVNLIFYIFRKKIF